MPDHLCDLPFFGGCVGKCVDGDDDRDLGVDVGGGGLSGDPFDEGVGHDLAAGAEVAGVLEGVGVLAQCREAGDALFDRKKAREDRHGVGRGAEPDPPVVAGSAPALDVGLGVGLVGVAAGEHRGPAGCATGSAMAGSPASCWSTAWRCCGSRWRVSETTSPAT